ncbi:Gfo/Idh/MocA family protein [Azospirillum sp. Marseille-Q6669]
MALGYADDPRTRRYYPYAAHAQVLRDHPAYRWDVAVDPDERALEAARAIWEVRHTARRIEDLPAEAAPDVVVLATPPTVRGSALAPFATARGVLAEKPLGSTLGEAEAFVALCRERGAALQVNFWRRCDRRLRALAEGGLVRRIGAPQAVTGVYGNGLLNNGSHVIDFARMLFGEVASVRALAPPRDHGALPFDGDFDVPFALTFDGGLLAVFQCLDFRHYREVGLDVWGERGRLRIANEGLSITIDPCTDNRAITGAKELCPEQAEPLASTAGHALFEVYDNLARSLADGSPLHSPGESALRTARTVEAVRLSALTGCPALTP